MLSIHFLLIMYFLYTEKSINFYFVASILLLIIAKYIHLYKGQVGSTEVTLNAFSYVFYLLILSKVLFKVTTKAILMFALPFIIVLSGVYLFYEDAINFMGSYAVNFYAISIGLFIITGLSLFYVNRNKKNAMLLLAVIFAIITSVVNVVSLKNHSFFYEAVINVTFIAIHFFMLQFSLLEVNQDATTEVLKTA